MALALAACRSPAPQLTAPAEAVTLRLRATESTIQLAHSLTREFGAARADQRVLAYVALTPYRSALAAAEDAADSLSYALVDYLPPDSPLWAAPVGQDRLAIIVHPDLQSAALSRTELRAIFSGEITSWAALGGPDLPVTPVSQAPGSAAHAAFTAAILPGSPLVSGARLVTSPEAAARIVGSTPGAIGYAPASGLPTDMQAREITPSDGPLDITLYITGPGEPQGSLRDFIAWVQSPPGQAVLARTHTSIFTP